MSDASAPAVPAPPTVRIDAAAPSAVPAPAGGDVRSIATALCTLLADARLAEASLGVWREGLRTAARHLAEAGLRGNIPPAEVRRAGEVARAAGIALDRRTRLSRWAADLDPILRDLAAADHAAGPRLLALARGILAETGDLAVGTLPPHALLPAPPSGRSERGVAAAFLTAWAATLYRPLRGDAEALVVAALARDVGELTPMPANAGRSDRPSEAATAHAARSAALLSICDRLPGAAARCAARHHERPDGGGGPAGLTAIDLTPADRLLAWTDRFLTLLSAPSARSADGQPDPAAAWRECWQSAAVVTYSAARRGELCLTIAAAGIEALGLSRGEQGESDAAGRVPVGLALTDLGRTRLRLDPAHPLAAPRFASAALASRQHADATATATAEEA
ncbi:HD domain-containing phosphohydrolase [Alienimonas chondri]|uniref:DUF222 domain-containing protein n=1 Tax=Alienimonas chondri TaxID=2681879 RepID=A0ABX1VGC8_9PLAN|nr:HD domain-containing phosphohydrolase [Alienimonas chondri]NNJ27160.1 hypothetical protein [Alienimonas chondri]